MMELFACETCHTERCYGNGIAPPDNSRVLITYEGTCRGLRWHRFARVTRDSEVIRVFRGQARERCWDQMDKVVYARGIR
jgi:hypothetical protein